MIQKKKPAAGSPKALVLVVAIIAATLIFPAALLAEDL